MDIKRKIKEVFNKAIRGGGSPQQLALSCSLGLYIAFSPFPGLHTVMMFVFKWLFDLNFPLLFLTTSCNNPWTMIPCYSGCYFFGYWFLHNICNVHPTWTISFAKIFGSGTICFWSFFVGGNLLGLLCAVISYPIFKYVFIKMTAIKVIPALKEEKLYTSSPTTDTRKNYERDYNK